MDFATTEDEGGHHCFGAGDALLGEEGGGRACGGGGFEFEDAFQSFRVFGEDGGEDEGEEGDEFGQVVLKGLIHEFEYLRGGGTVPVRRMRKFALSFMSSTYCLLVLFLSMWPSSKIQTYR